MSIVRAVLLLALIATAVLSAAPKWHELTSDYSFAQYVKDFRKVYDEAEYATREALFARNLEMILSHNAAPQHSYKLGVNHLVDRNVGELLALNGRVPDNTVQQPTPSSWFPAPSAEVVRDLPTEIDYRNTSYTFGVQVLTATKNQGHCGSCWAHASTESVETHYALATGELYVLSQQQMTSCANNSVLQCGGTGGCSGGTAQLGWDYLRSAGGQTQEWNYGYSSFFGKTGECSMNTSTMPPVVQVDGYTQVERNNADATLAALVQKGPLAVSVDASTWHFYETGIFSGCNYSQNISMDHAVQLIGFGHDSTLHMDYWLVRNSWSPKWGENGTIRLYRSSSNVSECGWNVNWTTNGGGCAGENTTLWACGMCGILYDTAFPNVVVPNSGNTGSGSSPMSKAWIAGVVVGALAAVVIVAIIIKKAAATTPSPEGDQLLDQH